MLPPMSASAPCYGCLKQLKSAQKGKKLKQGFQVTLEH